MVSDLFDIPFLERQELQAASARVWVMYLSSNNAIATVEVFDVHVHGASFALCDASSPSCRYQNNKQIDKFASSKNN